MASDIPAVTNSQHRPLDTAPQRVAPLRAVVIGGSGQIGGWLLRILAERGHVAVGTYSSVPFPELVHLDAADLKSAAEWVQVQEPDVVFYPAGFTWVDGCERDPRRAFASNCEQPLNLALARPPRWARFLYFSTDYVFDGRDGAYSQDSPAHPLSVYGRAKREAELELAAPLGDRQLTMAPPGSSGPSGKARTSPINCSRAWPRTSRWSVPRTRFPAPVTGPTWPVRPSGWPSSRRAG